MAILLQHLAIVLSLKSCETTPCSRQLNWQSRTCTLLSKNWDLKVQLNISLFCLRISHVPFDLFYLSHFYKVRSVKYVTHFKKVRYGNKVQRRHVIYASKRVRYIVALSNLNCWITVYYLSGDQALLLRNNPHIQVTVKSHNASSGYNVRGREM